MKSTFQHFYTLVYLNIWKYICSGCYTTQWVLSTLYTSRIFIINISKYTCTQLHMPHFTWRSKEIFGPETWAGGVADSGSTVAVLSVMLMFCSALSWWPALACCTEMVVRPSSLLPSPPVCHCWPWTSPGQAGPSHTAAAAQGARQPHRQHSESTAGVGGAGRLLPSFLAVITL